MILEVLFVDGFFVLLVRLDFDFLQMHHWRKGGRRLLLHLEAAKG